MGSVLSDTSPHPNSWSQISTDVHPSLSLSRWRAFFLASVWIERARSKFSFLVWKTSFYKNDWKWLWKHCQRLGGSWSLEALTRAGFRGLSWSRPWQHNQFYKIILSLFSAGVGRCANRNVEVRGQFVGLDSLLPPLSPGGHQIVRVGEKHFCSLSHLSSPTMNEFDLKEVCAMTAFTGVKCAFHLSPGRTFIKNKQNFAARKINCYYA